MGNFRDGKIYLPAIRLSCDCGIDIDHQPDKFFVKMRNSIDYRKVELSSGGSARLTIGGWSCNVPLPPTPFGGLTFVWPRQPPVPGVPAGAGVTFHAPPGDTEHGLSVKVQGPGTFQGLSYTVPAHTKGTLKAKVETLALTSQDIQTLRILVKSLLKASQWQKIEEEEKTHASADISFLAIFSDGGSASYDQTKKVNQRLC